MGKPNAYSLFVFDTAKRRRAQGIEVNQSFLFKELDSEWRNLPNEEREKYKNRAKNSMNYDSSTKFAERREKAFANEPKNPWATKQNDPADIKMNIKPDPDCPKPGTSNSYSDAKANIREIKEEIIRGIKRDREADANEPRQEPKKQKIRPGIPNWKNIKDRSTIEPVKYLHKKFYELRETCLSVLRSRKDNCLKTPIYAFSVNVLCKVKKGGKATFIPLEIGIFAYSIEDGPVGDPYHVIINSGPVPAGCLNISLEHANLNHKIPIPNRIETIDGYLDCARNDYKKIYKEMMEYTKTGERILLIENNYHLPQVHGTLDWLYNKASEGSGMKLPKPSSWTVVSIAEFVAGLTNNVKVDLLGDPSPELGIHSHLRVMQDSSIYDYNHNFMCEFHASLENRCRWCASNVAQRMIMNLMPAFDKIKKYFEAYKIKNREMLEAPPEKPAITYRDPLPQVIGETANEQLQLLPPENNQGPTSEIGPEDLPLLDPRLLIPQIEPDTIITMGEDSQLIIEKVIEQPKKPKKKEPLIFASTPACTGNREYF